MRATIEAHRRRVRENFMKDMHNNTLSEAQGGAGDTSEGAVQPAVQSAVQPAAKPAAKPAAQQAEGNSWSRL